MNRDDLQALVREIESAFPLCGDYETDARDRWPQRWEALVHCKANNTTAGTSACKICETCRHIFKATCKGYPLNQYQGDCPHHDFPHEPKQEEK